MKPFNARAVFWMRPDRVFRVYASDEKFFFIRIAGQSVDWAAALAQLGPLGIWLGRKLNERRDRSLQNRTEEADQVPPQVRVHQHPHSFQVGLNEITATRFEPGRQISIHGSYAAKWRLALGNGQKWDLIFENAAEANRAFEGLAAALGDRLVAKVEWDESKGKFRKKHAASQALA